MKVAVLQHDTAWEDPRANFERMRRLLDAAPDADLACMPEMFASGFSMNVAAIAEPPEGPTFQFLGSLARERGLYVQGSFPEQAGDMGLNACVTFDPHGRLLCRYHKIHPFSYGGEDKHYRKGVELPVFPLGEFQAATPICYDLRFPEIFRQAMRRGANLFIVPANWPVQRRHHWRSLAMARAIENLAWVIAINRVGEGGGLAFPGSSLVVSPTGEIVMDLDDREQAGVAEITLDEVDAARSRFGFLNDVRLDLFPDLFAT